VVEEVKFNINYGARNKCNCSVHCLPYVIHHSRTINICRNLNFKSCCKEIVIQYSLTMVLEVTNCNLTDTFAIEKRKQKAYDQLVSCVWSSVDSFPVVHTDIIFQCNNGNVAAHRLVLATVSKLIVQLLEDPIHRDEISIWILVPDETVSTVKKFLQLLYTGSACCEDEDERNRLVSFGVKQFGMSNFYHDDLSDVAPAKLTFEIVVKNIQENVAAPKIGLCQSEPKNPTNSLPLMHEKLNALKNSAVSSAFVQAQKLRNNVLMPTCDNIPSSPSVSAKESEDQLSEVRLHVRNNSVKKNVAETQTMKSLTNEIVQIQNKEIRTIEDLTNDIPQRATNATCSSSKSPLILEQINSNVEDQFRLYPMLAPSSKNKKTKSFECPECKKPFKYVSHVFQHAAMAHYIVKLRKFYEEEYVSNGGKCLRCPLLPRQKVLSSFLKHMGVVHRSFFGLVPDELRQSYDELRKQSASLRDRKIKKKKFEAKKSEKLFQENPTPIDKTVQNNWNQPENQVQYDNLYPNATDNSISDELVPIYEDLCEQSLHSKNGLKAAVLQDISNGQKVVAKLDSLPIIPPVQISISSGQKVVDTLDSLLNLPPKVFRLQTIGNQFEDIAVENNQVISKYNSIATSTGNQSEEILGDVSSESLPSEIPNNHAQIVLNDSSAFPLKAKRGMKGSIKRRSLPGKIKNQIKKTRTEDQYGAAIAAKQILKTSETMFAPNPEPVFICQPSKTKEISLQQSAEYSNAQVDNIFISNSIEEDHIQNVLNCIYDNTTSNQQSEFTVETSVKPLQDVLQNDKSLSVLLPVEPSDSESKLPSIEIHSDSDESPSTFDIKPESNDPILCLLCCRDFPNLHEYQRHLALFHFFKQIRIKYCLFESMSVDSLAFACDLCNSKPKPKSKHYVKFFNAELLAVHLSTVHDGCEEFATSELVDQLKQLKSTR
jgi:hypothetical protein